MSAWTVGQFIEYIQSQFSALEIPTLREKIVVTPGLLRGRLNAKMARLAQEMAATPHADFYTTAAMIDLIDSGDHAQGAIGELPDDFMAHRMTTLLSSDGRAISGPASEVPWEDWMASAASPRSRGTLLRPKVAVRKNEVEVSGTTA